MNYSKIFINNIIKNYFTRKSEMYIFFMLIFLQFLNYYYMIYMINIGTISIYRHIKFYIVKNCTEFIFTSFEI